MQIKKVSIIGMGALGILFGGFLSEKMGKDYVTFLVNKKRMKKFKEFGLDYNGKPANFNLVDEDEKGNPSDLIIFAVKDGDLNSAIQTAKNKISDNTIIMSLLNGVTSEEIIANAYGMDKIIYTIAQGMDPVRIDNKFNYTNMGQLCIGITNDNAIMNEKLNAVVELFDNIGLPYTLEADIKHRLWSKFMLNVGVNQVVMIYEGNYSTVQEPGEPREMMKAAMQEALAIANAEGVNVTQIDLDDYVNLIDTLDPKGMPSMRQDGLSQRKSEVDLFSGAVLKLGEKHRIATPVNKKIYDIVMEMESKYERQV